MTRKIPWPKSHALAPLGLVSLLCLAFLWALAGGAFAAEMIKKHDYTRLDNEKYRFVQMSIGELQANYEFILEYVNNPRSKKDRYYDACLVYLQANESMQQILNRTWVLMDEVGRAQGNKSLHEQTMEKYRMYLAYTAIPQCAGFKIIVRNLFFDMGPPAAHLFSFMSLATEYISLFDTMDDPEPGD